MAVLTLLFKRQTIKDNIQIFKALPTKRKRTMICLNVGGSLLLTANWYSFIYVMNNISVRATSLAYLICPILTTLLAFFLLREKLTRLQWFAVLLSCVGCVLLSYTDLSMMIFSALVGLSYALYMVSQKKNQGFDKFLILTFHIIFSSFVLLPFFFRFAGPVPQEANFYIYIEIIAVFFTIVPLFLNLFALGGIPSSTVGTLLNINPIIAFILSGVVYNEPLGGLQILAYTLIFMAVVIFNVSRLRIYRKDASLSS